jgi:hypothetical protein
MIFFIVVISLLLGFKLWWDFRAKNVEGRVINHARSALVDVVIYIAASGVFYPDFYAMVGAVIFACGFRWILFDAIFAKINWGTWIFYGESSWIDKQMAKLHEKFGLKHLLIKLIPLLIGILLVYL